MITLIKEESFKLLHKRSTPAITIILLVLMTAFGVLAKSYPKFYSPRTLFVQSFTGDSWVVLFMIAACSSIIAMEFQYGTIKEVLYRKYYRGQILVSKWLTMLIYSIYLFALVFVYSLILKFVLFNNTFDLGRKYGAEHSVFTSFSYTLIGDFVGLWLLLSLVLLLANIFKSSAAAISVGIIGYFALGVIAGLMTLAIQKWNWLKWNPLNMMNLSGQMNTPSMSKVTMLSTPELAWGSLAYTAIFLAISYVVFKRRSV